MCNGMRKEMTKPFPYTTTDTRMAVLTDSKLIGDKSKYNSA
jgi:hypothetical protein